MKRIFSLLLCLVMLVSVFSATATQVYALGAASDVFTVEKTEFVNNRITYTISIAANQTKLIGAVIKAKFDSAVLKVTDDSGEAGALNDQNEFAANITGYYETGCAYDDAGIYAVAFMNPNGYTIGDSAKAFVKITFEAISDIRPVTEVEFYCEEFITDDGDDTNDIRKSDGKQTFFTDSFLTLNPAYNVEVASCVEGLKFSWTAATGAEWYNIYRRTADAEWGDEPYYVVNDPAATEFIDEDIIQGEEYYYSVEAENSYGKRAYDTNGLVGLNFGTITEINIGLTERGAEVSWGALNGATSYSVHRKTDADSAWVKLDTVSETSYCDEPLTSGVTYYYTVKAYHEKGYVAEASIEAPSIEYIANASITFHQLNKADIVINWPQVDGATSYNVYRQATGDAEYTLVGTADNVTHAYTDTDVEDTKTYSYKVSSVTAAGVESILPAEGYTLIKLPITTSVSAALGEDNITVTWEPAELAEKYIISRRTTTGSWNDIATVSADATRYEDTAVTSGRTYLYAIKTYASGLTTSQSDMSNSVYYLAAPEIKSIANGSAGMELTFGAVEGAEIYNVFRKEANGQFGDVIGTFTHIDDVDNFTYVDPTAVSGVQYIYGVQSVYGDVKSAVIESSLACCLEEPEATLSSIYGGIKVSWKAVPGAESYNIYYGTKRDNENDVLLANVTELSYVHKTAVSGRSNYYSIEAVCGDTVSTMGRESHYYLAAPEIHYIDNGTNQITIRWNMVDGCDSYILYRRVGTGSWKKIATLKEDEDYDYVQYKDYDVTSGKKYSYRVKGYDGEEYTPYKSSGWSREFLKTPTVKSVKNVYGGVKVTWAKVTGAAKYAVFRKTSSSSWKFLGYSSGTTYTDKTAKSGYKYFYAVRSVDGESKSYKSTSHFNSVAKSLKYVAAPVVTLSNTTSGVKVSWAKVKGATKYEVYRKAGSASKWTKVKTTTSASYTDKNVKSGTNYKYMVKAYNNKLVSGYKSSGWTIKRLAAPTPLKVTSAKSGITFKWSKVTGASGYIVYRKLGSGSYEKLATVKGNAKISYLDKTAKKGKTYTYMVKAYYGSYTSANKTGLQIKDKY